MGVITAKITDQGQLTVPPAVRRRLSLRQGDEVAFIPDGGRIVIERLPGKAPSEKALGRRRRSGAEPPGTERTRAETGKIRFKKQAATGSATD